MVDCLPGAEITGQEGERTYLGAMKVKVGAVTVSYRGKLTFEEIVEEQRYLRMVGKGREKTGSGAVTLTMEGRVLARDHGRSAGSLAPETGARRDRGLGVRPAQPGDAGPGEHPPSGFRGVAGRSEQLGIQPSRRSAERGSRAAGGPIQLRPDRDARPFAD